MDNVTYIKTHMAFLQAATKFLVRTLKEQNNVPVDLVVRAVWTGEIKVKGNIDYSRWSHMRLYLLMSTAAKQGAFEGTLRYRKGRNGGFVLVDQGLEPMLKNVSVSDLIAYIPAKYLRTAIEKSR